MDFFVEIFSSWNLTASVVCTPVCLGIKNKPLKTVVLHLGLLLQKPDSTTGSSMDPADSSQLKNVLDLHGNMLGKHQNMLDAIAKQVESVSSSLTGLATQNQQIQLSLSAQRGPTGQEATATQRGSTSSSNPPAREPRLPPPEAYAGDPGSCEAFLTQCGLVFALQPTTFPSDESRVAYVITLLSGRARDWGTAIWTNRPALRTDFSEFSKEMKKVFDRSKQGREAAREVLLLRQGRQTVSDYSIQFRTLAVSAGWNAEAMYDVFFNGLSEEVKDELLPHTLPTGFDELVDMAIRVDVRLGQRRRMKTSLAFPRQETRLPTPVSSPVVPDTSEPMQVDRARLSPAERERRLRDKACLYCGQQGHFLANCPLKEDARQK